MLINWHDRRTEPMLWTTVVEGGGINRIEVTDNGSRYQLVEDKLARQSPLLKAWLVPLNDRDYSLRASWCVRRDRWTWFFKGVWKTMCKAEDAEVWLLNKLYDLRRKPDNDGAVLAWRDLR